MAARFLVTGGTGNWNSTTNWSATSGGASGASFPVAGDDVTLDALSAAAPLTVNVASACATIVCTGYTGTLTVTNVLTLTSTVTLAPTMTVAGAGTIAMTGAATLTTGGVTIGCALSMTGTVTYTLVDSFTVSGLLTLGATSATTTFTGAFTISAAGGFTQGGTGSQIASTGGITTIRISAAGTITAPNNASAQFRLNLTIDAGAGTVTFFNGIFCYGGSNVPTLTYTSGTVVMAGSSSQLNVQGSANFATAGIVWNKINFTGSLTATLTNDLSASGLVSMGGATNVLVLNGTNLNCPAGITLTFTSGSVSGTATIMVTGTGTLDATSVFTGRISNKVTINAPGATITFGDDFNIDLGHFLLTSVGSIVNADAQAWVFPSSGGSDVFIMAE